MNTSRKSRLTHLFLMCVSPDYRENFEFEKGTEIWNNLNENLPTPTGDFQKDYPRMQQFANRVRTTLTLKEKHLLVKWILRRLETIRNDVDEDISAYIRNYNEVWKRIYSSHLKVIS